MVEKYSSEVEKVMLNYYNSLQERDKRRYAAIEALKLGFGGKQYIYRLFQMSPNTLSRGISELLSDEGRIAFSRQRKVGGGRKPFFSLNRK